MRVKTVVKQAARAITSTFSSSDTDVLSTDILDTLKKEGSLGSPYFFLCRSTRRRETVLTLGSNRAVSHARALNEVDKPSRLLKTLVAATVASEPWRIFSIALSM
jgi:hypothetical protein